MDQFKIKNNYQRPVFIGLVGTLSLLALYFVILTLVSDWSFAQTQFLLYWYFIMALAGGFGAQLGLYTFLRQAIKDRAKLGATVAVSGTASTAAMISCCAHYLTNLAPLLAASGLVLFVARYQVPIFWLGLVFNFGGLAYSLRQIKKFKQTKV